MDNRVAELLNVDGKRGIKLAFVKMDLYTILIGKLLHLYYTDQMIDRCQNYKTYSTYYTFFLSIYNSVIDSVKHLFPDEPVPLIKNQISDWLKQAPRRK